MWFFNSNETKSASLNELPPSSPKEGSGGSGTFLLPPPAGDTFESASINDDSRIGRSNYSRRTFHEKARRGGSPTVIPTGRKSSRRSLKIRESIYDEELFLEGVDSVNAVNILSADDSNYRLVDNFRKRRMKVSKPSTKSRKCLCHCSCSPIAILVILSQMLLVGCIALECLALYDDQNWNTIVEGTDSFPPMTANQTYFTKKKLHLHFSSGSKKLIPLLRRDSAFAIAFVAILGNAVTIGFLHAVLVYTVAFSTEGSRTSSVTYFIIGGMSFSSAMVILTHVSVDYQINAREATDHLFTQNFHEKGHHNHRNLGINEEVFENALSFCGYRAHPIPAHERSPHDEQDVDGVIDSTIESNSLKIHFTSNKVESYSIEDLTKLGFCYDLVKTEALYISTFIATALCWTIPVLNYFRGKCCAYCLKEEEDILQLNKFVLTPSERWIASGGQDIDDSSPIRARIHPDEAYV